MPYLPNPIPIVAVKLVGYTVAGIVLNKVFKKDVLPPLFGIIRTFLGLALGLLTVALAGIITPYVWYVGLRIAVWYFLIRYFYEREGWANKRFRIAVFGGVAWSFILDGILSLLSLAFPDSMNIPWC